MDLVLLNKHPVVLPALNRVQKKPTSHMKLMCHTKAQLWFSSFPRSTNPATCDKQERNCISVNFSSVLQKLFMSLLPTKYGFTRGFNTLLRFCSEFLWEKVRPAQPLFPVCMLALLPNRAPAGHPQGECWQGRLSCFSLLFSGRGGLEHGNTTGFQSHLSSSEDGMLEKLDKE